MPVNIFFCYAREDEALLNKLKTHLRPLQRQGLIDVWYDRDIHAGAEWEQEIKEHLNSAQIILLLVSPDFMDSDYCYSIEMTRALERHARGEARVIPVIVRPVYWHGEPLGKLQALPTDGKPVTSSYWQDADSAFYDVTNGIYKVAMLLASPPAFASPAVPGEIQQEITKPSVITPAVRQVGNASPLNIASDIVEHHAKDLEGTVAGRLLKWSGLIEPDFRDRLRDTIKKALELFFQTYPQYDLSGIEGFFRDPAVARQIGGYILSRQPIDEQQIQQALDQHLKKDAITFLLMQRRNVLPQNIIPDFLKCYRRVLNLQLSVPEMAILLEVVDQNDKVLAEIGASEARMRVFIADLLKTRLSPEALHAASQAGQKEVAADLTQQMEAAKLVQPDEATQTIQKRLQSLPALFTDGLCKGRMLQSAPQQYFVSHGFAPDTLVDWRRTLTETLAQASKTPQTLMPYFSGDTLMGGYRFCGVCEKLYATRFSIFLLPPSQDRNVYLELGIAIGLGAPFLLIQPRGAKIPSVLEGLSSYISNGTFRTIRQELPEKVGKIEDYDFAVVRLIKDLPAAGNQAKYLIAAGNLFNDDDVEGSIADTIKATYPHLEAVSLTKQAETASTSWMIEQLIDTIQTTRFAIYHVNADCSATTFLALGISIALNRPFLMIRETGSEVPADLRGIGLYQFPNFVTLEKDFIAQHRSFFDRHAR